MKKQILTITLAIFGLITLFVSSSVLFDWFGMRQNEGNFVPVIVWANWVCGFLYLLSAFYIFKGNAAAKIFLLLTLGILICTYIFLFIYLTSGGLYETKTIGAMAFRLLLTGFFLLSTIKNFKK